MHLNKHFGEPEWFSTVRCGELHEHRLREQLDVCGESERRDSVRLRQGLLQHLWEPPGLRKYVAPAFIVLVADRCATTDMTVLFFFDLFELYLQPVLFV